MAKRLSGLQKEVLHLYKKCLKETYKKPPSTQIHWQNFVKEEFHKYNHLPKKQFNTIEHLIRVGEKKFEMYSNPQIKDIH